MKKIAFIACAILAVSFTSCDKEKNCKCVVSASMNGETIGESITTTVTIKDGECSDGNATATAQGMVSKTVCTEE